MPGLTGVALQPEGVCVVRVERNGAQPPVLTLADFRPWAEAGAEDKLLARLAADHDLRRSRVATVLDQKDYSLLVTEAPDVPADELRAALRWRIKDLIDFHINDLRLLSIRGRPRGRNDDSNPSRFVVNFTQCVLPKGEPRLTHCRKALSSTLRHRCREPCQGTWNLRRPWKAHRLINVKYTDRITFDPEQCGGRPCIRHYRLRVKDVLDLLAAGVSESEILKDYPFLEPEDIRACLEFASEQVNHPVIIAA